MAKQSEEMKSINRFIRALEEAKTEEECYVNFGYAMNTLRELYMKKIDVIINGEKNA